MASPTEPARAAPAPVAARRDQGLRRGRRRRARARRRRPRHRRRASSSRSPGASGSGKSTAMSILGCLELPTDGEYRIEGFPVQDLSADVLAALRNTRFGFVFQQFNLLARTSALENVAMPLVYAGVGARERTRRARRGARRRRPRRARAARAPTSSPAASSSASRSRARSSTSPRSSWPTSRPATSTRRWAPRSCSSSRALNRERGITVLMVTHDADCAAYARRQVVFRDGRIVSDDTRAGGRVVIVAPPPASRSRRSCATRCARC